MGYQAYGRQAQQELTGLTMPAMSDEERLRRVWRRHQALRRQMTFADAVRDPLFGPLLRAHAGLHRETSHD